MSEPKKIDECWAWVCTEPNGGEGIPAINSPIGPLPMIGADRVRVESMRSYAVAIASEMNYPVRLVRFYGMEVIEHLPTGPVKGSC